MKEQQFLETVSERSKELNINTLLLLSGIEGLYTFRDVEMSGINYDFLDSLILTIFTLRVGDQFHSMAEENLSSTNSSLQMAAINELTEITQEQISRSGDLYLQSFAQVLAGKTPVRRYHLKALEVAAIEIRKAQVLFEDNSIGSIVITICKNDPDNHFGLSALFAAS